MLSLTETYYDSNEKIWHGPLKKDIYNANLTLGEAALVQLNKNRQKIIQIMDTTGETLTGQQLMDYSIILARKLMNVNIKAGDVIGLYAQNSTHVVTVLLASFLCGAPVNAVFPEFDTENVSLIYKTTRPKIIFCDVENYANAKAVSNILNLNATIVLMNGEITGVSSVRNLLESDDKLLNGELKEFQLPCQQLKGDDTAIIACSSGTTGTPKGVICSHYALLNKTIFSTILSDSVVFNFSTMYWISGILTVISSLRNGVLRIVTNKPYTPEYFLYLVEHYKISHVICGGSQMAELILNVKEETIRKSLQSIDTLMCGGSKIPEIVQDKMIKILTDNSNRPGFCVAYGMSELCGLLSLNGGTPYHFSNYTEGKLAPNEKVRIVDKLGNSLTPNELGEIQIQTPYKFMGYYKNPEVTAKALNNGWICSGDIGYFDDNGFLHVCGRDKDVFKSFNFQIYPQVIEDLILKIPGVAEVCVCGIPDLIASNLTACAVVRTQDNLGMELSANTISQYIKNNMTNVYHLKGGVHFVDTLPKTSSGKIQRNLVLDLIIKN